MVTREQIEKYFGEDSEMESSFGEHEVDTKVVAINLLRERIPYEVEKRIINAAEHDIVYLVEVENSMPYLTEEDLQKLLDCNIGVDEEYRFIYNVYITMQTIHGK